MYSGGNGGIYVVLRLWECYGSLLPHPELSDGRLPWGAVKEELRCVFIQEGISEIAENVFTTVDYRCRYYIPESVTTIAPGTIKKESDIFGVPRSTAELYATQNGNDFNALGDVYILQGDMNNSGKYEAEDALAVLKMVVGLETMYKWSGDANWRDGVTAEDALFILNDIVGKQE